MKHSFTLLLFLFVTPWVLAFNNDGYTDYLPRYRKMSEQFIISKVEYQGTGRTILYFRFVASKDKDLIRFFGSKHEQSWRITSTAGASTSMNLRQCQVKNIRLNDVLQLAQVGDDQTFSLEGNRGDIISCEIVFDKLPGYVRSFNLVGGEKGKNNEERFNCYDLVVKAKDSQDLGTKEQMEVIIDRFYTKECKYVRYRDVKEVTTLEQERHFEQRKQEIKSVQADAPVKASMEAAYMPRMFTRIEDLKCQERFILSNVYFEDNSADFSRRNQAMKTFGSLADYLKQFPDAKIMLHGHTDIHGDEYRNLVLSKDRVMAVKKALVDKGIQANRIITLYYGGKQPLPLYEEGGNMNRRVEIEIICSGQQSQIQQPQVKIQASNSN